MQSLQNKLSTRVVSPACNVRPIARATRPSARQVSTHAVSKEQLQGESLFVVEDASAKLVFPLSTSFLLHSQAHTAS
jgi:hypothetical protein